MACCAIETPRLEGIGLRIYPFIIVPKEICPTFREDKRVLKKG
ncbi:MAG: hypothetical protein Metus_0091 [Candidatus Methanosuratincola subterraneus]|uniref:Uncharacterized protein n=1 Tax=Methanosuratincola subterraneus TaxID=2593994 RepID=A0A444L8Z3_METS7|nr:MAG: hypothetical protein Metus_0091 [Candidatus Methanosuratincola subterraneus]